MSLTFDPEKHEYRHNGRRVPYVTQVLTGAGLIDAQWFDDAAAWRGSVVHKCCELDCLGTLREETVDPGAAGYLAAWRAWKQNTGFKPVDIEKRRYHKALQYAGTPDRVGILPDGSHAVVDLKTGAAAKWHAIQLAGYAYLLPAPLAIRLFTVRLSADGKYVTTEYPNLSHDWAAFHAALTLNNWRRINGC